MITANRPIPGMRRGIVIRREEVLLGALVCLLAACLTVLCAEGRANPAKQRAAREFQTLVHGVGLGPAVDPSRCAMAFDPRLMSRCPHDTDTLPLGGAFCPFHTLSVSPYPSLDQGSVHERPL